MCTYVSSYNYCSGSNICTLLLKITISLNNKSPFFFCRTKGVLELLEKNYRIHQSLTDTVSSIHPLLLGHGKDQSIPVLYVHAFALLQERNSVQTHNKSNHYLVIIVWPWHIFYETPCNIYV